MIYLAAPYSSPSLETRNWRYQRAKAALFGLWAQGEPAICPIVLGHEFEQRQRSGPQVMPHDFWMKMARAQLSCCTKLWVLTLKGWRESIGLGEEVVLAHGMNRPIVGYMPFPEDSACDQDITGVDIMKEFGVWKPSQKTGSAA